MKTVLQDRSGNIPDGIQPQLRQWITLQNTENKRDHQDLEDEFSKIGAVKFWTPAITFDTPGDLSVGYATQIGDLVRIKDLIIATFQVITSSFTHTTSSGNLRITGLPYSGSLRSSDSGYIWNGTLAAQGWTKANYTYLNSQMRAGNNYLLAVASGSAEANALMGSGDFPTGGSVALIGTISYRIKP